MATQEQMRKMRAAAQSERDRARKMLEVLYRTGQSRGYGSHLPTGPYTANQNVFPGSFTMADGAAPSEADVDRFIASMGGNKASKRLLAMLKRETGGRVSPGHSVGDSIAPASDANEETALERLYAKIQEAADAAFNRNEARDKEIRGLKGKFGEKEGLYARTMGEVDNFGKAASADLEQRAKDAFGAIQANLSARGLGGSSIIDAFRQKNASDLAREQQRLSEMVSNRRITNDQALTNDLSGFIERQEDVARDPTEFLPLLLQYAQSGQGQGYNNLPQQQGNNRQRYQPMNQLPGGGGVSPYAAMQMQANLNQQLAPMQRAAWGGGGYAVPQQPVFYDEPMYDVPQGLTPVQMRVMREQQAKQARINNRFAAQQQRRVRGRPMMDDGMRPGYQML